MSIVVLEKTKFIEFLHNVQKAALQNYAEQLFKNWDYPLVV